jgi:hypothetical protein
MTENGTVAATEETTLTTAGTTTNENAQTAEQTTPEAPATTEDIAYHTVEKDGNVTAIWEMQGRKHIRTIDPRSNEGKQILELFETAG